MITLTIYTNGAYSLTDGIFIGHADAQIKQQIDVTNMTDEEIQALIDKIPTMA